MTIDDKINLVLNRFRKLFDSYNELEAMLNSILDDEKFKIINVTSKRITELLERIKTNKMNLFVYYMNYIENIQFAQSEEFMLLEYNDPVSYISEKTVETNKIIEQNINKIESIKMMISLILN